MDYFLFNFSGVQFHYTMSHLKLFGKTFYQKSFCFAALSKKREPFLQFLSVMKEVDITNHAGDFV